MANGSTRRGFLIRAVAAAAAGALVSVRRVSAVVAGRHFATGSKVPATRPAGLQTPSQPSALTHGPFLGHLTPSRASVWARFSSPGEYRLVALGPRGEASARVEAKAESNQTVVWHLSGLEPQSTYRYEITRQGRTLFSAPDAFFVTPATQDTPSITRLAIGSCAREAEGDAAVWRRMAGLEPHAVVLLGDTPYIDSTDLEVQRTRYGEFAAVPDFAELIRSRPLYATWDDHDFGANDTDGQLPGKENSRQAFVEFHANPSYGDGQEGVYTKFVIGGTEVFLLDTRYFAGTEMSPIADGPTLLGTKQWEWLSEGLRSSTAPFKLLASGLVWNGAVRPGKRDHWDSYRPERDALFRFIGEEGITGVVLLGGDVHRTRVLRYDTEDAVGYALTELITSPIHSGVIEEANAPHPALVHDSGEPHSFLLMTIDTTVTPPTLHAQFQNAEGRELYSLTLDATELSRA